MRQYDRQLALRVNIESIESSRIDIQTKIFMREDKDSMFSIIVN
jgi:hypothetical protein